MPRLSPTLATSHQGPFDARDKAEQLAQQRARELAEDRLDDVELDVADPDEEAPAQKADEPLDRTSHPHKWSGHNP